MAMLTETHTAAPMTTGLGRFLANLAERIERRAVFNRTLTELMSLSNRELSDLGMSRSSIRSIAWEHAYGAR